MIGIVERSGHRLTGGGGTERLQRERGDRGRFRKAGSDQQPCQLLKVLGTDGDEQMQIREFIGGLYELFDEPPAMSTPLATPLVGARKQQIGLVHCGEYGDRHGIVSTTRPP